MQVMLAAKITEEQLKELKYPVLGSVKIDGIRCIANNRKAVTRKIIDIPNEYIRTTIIKEVGSLGITDCVDGEIGCTIDNRKDFDVYDIDYNTTNSCVRSFEGKPNFKFFLFDRLCSDQYINRRNSLHAVKTEHITVIPQVLLNSPDEVLAFEAEALKLGAEGIMIRTTYGPYKYGRSTGNTYQKCQLSKRELEEGILYKFKRFEQDEAEITGFEEKLINCNEAEIDGTGHTKRSTNAENMLAADTLGAITVVGISGKFKGVEFSIGSGFDDATRDLVWKNKELYK
jgi:DNA ligase-1